MKKKSYNGISEWTNNPSFLNEISNYYKNSIGTDAVKISQFPKYIQEIDLRNFLFKIEVFKKILQIHGSVIEMGVLFGGSLMTWAKLSSILEPVNYSRKIIGFDTFSGFPSISTKDKQTKSNLKKFNIPSLKKGDYFADAYDDILESIKLYDKDRYQGSKPKIELVKGDASKTIPKYLKENSHTMISLLNLDLDLYEPTKIALKHFVPRMPKGAIICFDELNHPKFPGETLAVLEELGIHNLKIQRIEFAPSPSFVVLE